jgi:hypothetical protein
VSRITNIAPGRFDRGYDKGRVAGTIGGNGFANFKEAAG